MSYTPHEIALQSWVASVLVPLGFDPIIFADQGGPKPITAYAFMRVLSDVSTGPIEVRTGRVDANTASHRYIDRREGTVSITVMGTDFYQGALALHRSLRKQDTINLNEAASLVVRGSLGGIQVLGIDSGGVLNARAVVDFEFGYSSEETTQDDEFVKETTTQGTYNA